MIVRTPDSQFSASEKMVANAPRSANKPARGGITSTAGRFSCATPKLRKNEPS